MNYTAATQLRKWQTVINFPNISLFFDRLSSSSEPVIATAMLRTVEVHLEVVHRHATSQGSILAVEKEETLVQFNRESRGDNNHIGSNLSLSIKILLYLKL